MNESLSAPARVAPRSGELYPARTTPSPTASESLLARTVPFTIHPTTTAHS